MSNEKSKNFQHGMSEQQAYRHVLDSDLIKVYESHHNNSIDAHYLDRPDRNRFAAEQLGTSKVKSILNLGGGGARHLQESLANETISVYEVDMQGDCDLKTNLDELDRLPFDDNSFDVVCAFDLLEHVENFHFLNDEMLRVAKDYVLISLPNCGAEIFYNPLRNNPQTEPDFDRGTFSKFAGLPLKIPSDRHRWWIYFQDIIRFYYYLSIIRGVSLEFWTPRLNVKKKLFKAIFSSHIYHTFFCTHVWIKLSKPQS